MITINQLLESVDLDFEPRFVTKDLDGEVNIWEVKPVYRVNDYYGLDDDNYGEIASFGKIKLAEFENKPWQECIYEVPRKTTRKIEKMLEQKLTIGKTKYEYPTSAMLIDKINEIIDWINKVDAVNELKGVKNE